MSSNDSTTPSFDPFTQPITLLNSENLPINITVSDITDLLYDAASFSDVYAAQIGASLILLIVLLLLTRPEKRKAPVFILNTISLLINIIRNILFTLYFTSPFLDVYAYFGQDYSRVPASAYGTQIGAIILTFLLLLLVEASLCLQVKIVLITLRKLYQRLILGFSLLIASIAITFRLAYSIQNIKFIVNTMPEDGLVWMGKSNNITTAMSICWFCAVFVGKLGMSVRERRRLGVGQWGPTQIIFVMGCQTLVVPAIFAILQFTTSVPAISTNVLTTVVIFLPLSSLWASATVTASSSRNQLPSSSYNSNNTRTSSNTFGTLGSSASTQVSKHIGGGTYLKNKFLAFGGSSGGFHIPASSSPGGGPILIGTHGYGNGLAAGFGGTGGYLGNSNSTENEGNDGLRSGWLSPGSNISMQDHHNGNVANAVDRDLEAQGLDAGVVGGGERKG